MSKPVVYDDFKLPVREELKKKYKEVWAKAERGHALSAIRLACAECGGSTYEEVRSCPDHGCFMWPFRLGKTPKKVTVTPEHLERLRVMREKRGAKSS